MKQKSKFKLTEMGMIPEDWEIKKIREVTELIFSGGTPNTGKTEYWNGKIPWLSSGETRDRFIRSTEKNITKKGVENSSTRLAKKADIVVASAGQGYTRGQTAFCMIDSYINQSVVALRANKKLMESLFLFYNLISRYNELRQVSDAHSSRGSLTTKLLADLNIQVPPLPEQSTIAKILSDLDLKIELNQQMNKTLESIAQATFKHWFIDFEFPNEEGKPYKSSGGETVDSELGKIPRGWEIKRLEEITEVIFSGGTPDTRDDEYWDGKYPWLASGETGDHFIVKTEKTITEQGIENSSTKMAKIGDIVIASAGQGSTRGQISFCLIDTYINQSIVALRAKDNMIPNSYLFFSLSMRYPELRAISDSHSSRGSLTTKLLKDLTIVVPPLRNLDVFNLWFIPIVKEIHSNLIENQILSQIRDSLLPKLMSGKIRVPVEVK